MSLFQILLIAFITMPVVELWLLIGIGSRIGAGTTILVILMTGVIGARLAHQQGLSILRRVQHRLEHGQLPDKELWDGLCVFIGGLLLLTPGFITDGIGFLLLWDPARTWLRHRIFQHMIVRGSTRDEEERTARLLYPDAEDAEFFEDT